MKIAIKNMVCDRCIMTVRKVLTDLHLTVTDISLGLATISQNPDEAKMLAVANSLRSAGFELLDSEKNQLIERIKNLIIQQVHYTDLNQRLVNFSDFLSEELSKDYNFLSKLFSESAGITIEKFIIQQKIEKVKELLVYGESNLNEIAFQMDYSSSAHLSAQFKSVTGFTPSQYRAEKNKNRISLDKI